MANREWIRRDELEWEPWHLRASVGGARRLRARSAACGLTFLARDSVIVWRGEDLPPGVDRCSVCETAREALEAIEH
jgi:hypothetical protein